MGMKTTPLTHEVPLTTSNLVVDSDLSMGEHNLQANNLHVDGSILRVIECIPDDTIYYHVESHGGTTSGIILAYIPSTYYHGSINVRKRDSDTNYVRFRFHKINSIETTDITTTAFTEVIIPNGCIAISYHVVARSGYTGYIGCDIGFTNDYLPLSTPPETP